MFPSKKDVCGLIKDSLLSVEGARVVINSLSRLASFLPAGVLAYSFAVIIGELKSILETGVWCVIGVIGEESKSLGDNRNL